MQPRSRARTVCRRVNSPAGAHSCPGVSGGCNAAFRRSTGRAHRGCSRGIGCDCPEGRRRRRGACCAAGPATLSPGLGGAVWARWGAVSVRAARCPGECGRCNGSETRLHPAGRGVVTPTGGRCHPTATAAPAARRAVPPRPGAARGLGPAITAEAVYGVRNSPQHTRSASDISPTVARARTASMMSGMRCGRDPLFAPP